MRHLIIGGGIAGTTAAEALRKLDASAEITLVSEEHHPVYSRVLLPHYVKGKVPRERVFLKRPEWYGAQNIEWITGLRVEKLDPKNGYAGLSDGREIPFDKVLIVTGGDVRSLGEEKRGVSYLRTLDDADHLLQLLNERGPKARGGIYGAGFIALEYLNIFRYYELPIALACRSAHFWTRMLKDEAGELINEHLRSKGVELVTGAQYLEAVGDKQVTGMRTDKGGINCDILGIGVGLEADLSWISEAGIEVGRGIITNEYLETNVPNVYAAGDIAEFHDVIAGRHLQAGNWLAAMSQGRAVARTMTGERTAYELVSSYSANALGLEIVVVGDASLEHAEEVIVRGTAGSGGVTQLYLRGGRLVGGVMIGRNADRTPVTKLIREKADIGQKAASWADSTVEIG